MDYITIQCAAMNSPSKIYTVTVWKESVNLFQDLYGGVSLFWS
jgi:hypothetical protein